MSKPRKTALKDLAARIGHDFSNPALLKLALTHSSARASTKPDEDNERLEFLGDRVLGLAVAELLTDAFPKAPEGELARWFNQLVRAETCAEIAQSWDLGDLILMSGGEAGSGGRRKKTILANTCEAVLGAVFADGGYEAAKRVVRAFWEPQLGVIDLAAPDAKSVLQEWAQGRRLPLPRYLEVAREGPDHAPRFTCRGPDRRRGAGARARGKQARS